jgi:hypothetical protein
MAGQWNSFGSNRIDSDEISLPISAKDTAHLSLTGNSMVNPGNGYSARLSNSSVELRGNQLSRAEVSGGSASFSMNAFFGISPALTVSGAEVTLNDTRAGNYWGRDSPPFFMAGIDTNDTSIVDHHPLDSSMNPQGASGTSDIVSSLFVPLLFIVVAALAWMLLKKYKKL